MPLYTLDEKSEISIISDDKINSNLNTPLRNNNNNMNSNTNFNSNPNNMSINFNSNMQTVPSTNDVYFNNMIRIQNIPNYSSPLRPINENIVMNNYTNQNSNQRNNLNQHQQMNLQGNINKNNFLNNSNINMISNYGNVAQMTNITNQQNRINSNATNQQFVNFMAIPIMDGTNNTGIPQKGFNYQINNVFNLINFFHKIFFYYNHKKNYCVPLIKSFVLCLLILKNNLIIYLIFNLNLLNGKYL